MLKLALCFLVWPILAVAQDPPPPQNPPSPAQYDTSAQGPIGTQSLLPAPSTAIEASPTPIIPVSPQTHKFIRLRPITQPTVPATYFPLFNFSAGYSITALGINSSSHVALGGFNGGISLNSNKRFGATLDLGYARASNAFSTGHDMSVLTYLVGPVFCPSDRGPLNTYVHLLVGGAKISGPFANTSRGLLIGQVHYPAWELGGGAEYSLSRTLGFRISIDYLHTHFYDPAGIVRGQHDIRVVNSIVYYLGVPSYKDR